jgi:hypothetical protein
MTTIVRWALVVALATAPAARAGAGECRGKLSGAVKGKFRCAVAVEPAADGKTYFVITAREPVEGVPAYAPGAFEVPGEVKAATYTLDTLGMGRASVAVEGGALYTATKTSSQRGEVTITLRSVQRNSVGGYTVHGTYRARLAPAGGGKPGEVVVEVTF